MSRKWKKPKLSEQSILVQPSLQDAGVEYWRIETTAHMYQAAITDEFNRLGKERWCFLGVDSSGANVFARRL